MFVRLSPEETGLRAENRYDDPRIWGELYHEFEVGEIGTGVAIGDYDGDGRPDIYVVSKTEGCRLFRNLGGYRFEDVTEKAGVGATPGVWNQGATFVDINNNGRLDIYVCRFNAPNLLYVNQGDGTFKEMAHAYGLDVNDASSMACFCDYDRDGWLDLFLQTNMLNYSRSPNGQRSYMFHNNRNGTFTNVTERAGISGEAHGHSAVWWDYDNDGWPDLYVANDFSLPDFLYHNNRDGTFTQVVDRVIPHMPFSSMGSDLGDVNNDGLIDLFVTDMAATTHEQDQRGMAESRSHTAEDDRNPDAAPQYERNALYLNTGTGRCLEAAYLAGIAATNWTWSPRFEDLDNDGRLDLFVTNGSHRESTNVDILARQAGADTAAERIRIMRDSPVMAETHLAFRNLGDLQFEDVSAAWGLNQRGVSFGTALGDLSGDGNLDIVYTNFQGGVTILRNDNDTGHRVDVDLRGTVSNRYGVGATVRIESALGVQVRQLVLARGYLSSSEPMVHFGLGDGRGHPPHDRDLAERPRADLREPAGGQALHGHGALRARPALPGCAARPAPVRGGVRPAGPLPRVARGDGRRDRHAAPDPAAPQPPGPRPRGGGRRRQRARRRRGRGHDPQSQAPSSRRRPRPVRGRRRRPRQGDLPHGRRPFAPLRRRGQWEGRTSSSRGAATPCRPDPRNTSLGCS